MNLNLSICTTEMSPFILSTYESSCLSAWDNCHNIWPLLNICGPPNLVLVQIWIPRIGRLSKTLGDESKVVHGHVQEPELYTWSVQPVQHMNQTSEPRDHFSACLVFDRSCLNGSKRRSGLLIEKHSIHVANVQKHLRAGPWHERMSVSYIKAVWSNKKTCLLQSSLTRRVDTVNVKLLYTRYAFCLPVLLVDV